MDYLGIPLLGMDEIWSRLPDSAIAQLDQSVVIPPGGTGKSTTMVQLAERMLAEDGPVPLLVPLGEWSDRHDDFFDFLVRRNSFGTFRRQHLMQLAYHGRLVLLLDGWNELTPEARLRAMHDITALQRDYSQLGFVISTRRQALPFVGPVVDIETLSQDQQMELARVVRGQEGVDLVDRAWRTVGVRELVGIPLYLNALLTSGFDGMELVAKLTADDPDPEVIVAVVESLAFRRGDRHVNRIMQAAPDPVWKAVAEKNYPYHLTDPQLDARLAAERAEARAAETDPVRKRRTPSALMLIGTLDLPMYPEECFDCCRSRDH